MTPLLLAALLAAVPSLYWPRPPATAAELRNAGLTRVLVPPDAVDGWAGTGIAATPFTPAALAARVSLTPPGAQRARPDVASATHRPWLDANGWRLLRSPRQRYAYLLPAGRAALAAAEAYAYGADAVLTIDPSDLEPLGRMLSFLSTVPPADLAVVADVVVVDDGTPEIGEVLNLLVRRNILVTAVGARGALAARPGALPILVRFGTKAYPRSEMDDPEAFASRMRQAIGDQRRTLRLYGSEVVLARLTGNAHRRRLHLLNYGGRIVEGLRVRVSGRWAVTAAYASGQPPAAVEDEVRVGGATEFSLPSIETYAVIDLTAAR